MNTTFRACGVALLIGLGSACNRPTSVLESIATDTAPKSGLSSTTIDAPVTSPETVAEQAAADQSLQLGSLNETQVTTLVNAEVNSNGSPSSGDAAFRVMSWNLEWFYDDEPNDNYSKLAKEQTAPSRAKWDWKRDAVASSIQLSKPSVAAFQEIENRRVLWYLARALDRNHKIAYREICIEGDDVFTEQDVGFIYRSGNDEGVKPLLQIEPVLSATFGRTASMRRDNQTAEVSKHLLVDYEVSYGEHVETVSILTLHLRAREEAVQTRTKQARTVHAWLADRVRTGANVIVLGDFNTEESTIPAVSGSDMAAACGFDTSDTDDDLVDLHDRIPERERQTHLLPGKSFDRILVSPALIADDPNKVDLVFTEIETLKSLSVRGNADVPDEHWNGYWSMDDENRDISDHWPVMATFEFK